MFSLALYKTHGHLSLESNVSMLVQKSIHSLHKLQTKTTLVIVSRFVSELGQEVKGNIDLVYPYGSLKPIRDLLRSRVQTGDGDEASDKEWSSELKNASLDAGMPVTVELGQIETTLSVFGKFESRGYYRFQKAGTCEGSGQ